ncbi:MAG: amidohydrolase [Lentisphaeria bacterium]|nr:amidohydrolase [Lentisphaeria bacterium]
MDFDFYDVDILIGREIDEYEETAPTIDDVNKELQRFNVSRALVSNKKMFISNPKRGNADLQEAVSGYDNLRGIYGINTFEERHHTPSPLIVLDAVLKMNPAGLQLWPIHETWSFSTWQCPELFDAISQHRLPVFIHWNQISDHNELVRVLQKWPDMKVVVQRVDYNSFRRFAAMMKVCANLYITTTPKFVGGSAIEELDYQVGHDRILFGSGLFNYDILPAVGQITYANLSDEKKADIASGNLLRILEEIK